MPTKQGKSKGKAKQRLCRPPPLPPNHSSLVAISQHDSFSDRLPPATVSYSCSVNYLRVTTDLFLWRWW
ncbi:hypothetical protein Bca4012_056187 [Brassica carinata]